MESENGQTSGAKYKNWIDTYLAQKYNGTIKGDDIWKLRCASLHQGKFNHDNPNYEQIVFQIPENGLLLHNNIMNNTLQLNVETFISDMVNSYKDWSYQNGNNIFINENMNKSFRLYDNGFPGLINVGKFIG